MKLDRPVRVNHVISRCTITEHLCIGRLAQTTFPVQHLLIFAIFKLTRHLSTLDMYAMKTFIIYELPYAWKGDERLRYTLIRPYLALECTHTSVSVCQCLRLLGGTQRVEWLESCLVERWPPLMTGCLRLVSRCLECCPPSLPTRSLRLVWWPSTVVPLRCWLVVLVEPRPLTGDLPGVIPFSTLKQKDA